MPLLILVALLIGSLLTTQSCRKISDFEDFEGLLNEEFNEINNLSDEMWIDGIVAVPILDTKLPLSQFIPSSDSSLFVEIDDNSLIHLRMYFKKVLSISTNDIYEGIADLPAGTTIPATTFGFATDNSKMKIYENALSGHLFFNDPKITFIFKNSIPLVSYFKLNSITFLNAIGDTSSITPTNFVKLLNTPTATGTYANTDVYIDKVELPELPDIFSPIPKYLAFKMTVGSDSDQQLPYALNNTDSISVDIDVDIPLEARLIDFVLGDTVDFDFASDTNNIEQIKAVTIKLMFDNFIPASGIMNISFHDVNNDSIINPTPILVLENDDNDGKFEFLEAITDGSGVPTSSQKSQFTIHLTQEQLTTLKTNHAAKIVLTGTFNSHQSTSEQYVKIYSWCTLGIKLGVRVDYGGSTGDIPE